MALFSKMGRGIEHHFFSKAGQLTTSVMGPGDSCPETLLMRNATGVYSKAPAGDRQSSGLAGSRVRPQQERRSVDRRSPLHLTSEWNARIVHLDV
jgi:hypothetical protein